MHLSIIIPTLNEASCIIDCLKPLQAIRAQGHEIVISDGDSNDSTIKLATPLVDQVVSSSRGRAKQMNAGAGVAKGDILLFLHADTILPKNSTQLVINGLSTTHLCWGRFDVRLDGRHWMLRIIEKSMNLRSRLTGIATGDQAIFVKRNIFMQAGRIPDIPLMEDIQLSKKLKAFSRPLCLRENVTTSSRRWEQRGILLTILLMWRLRFSHFLGADISSLARQYK